MSSAWTTYYWYVHLRGRWSSLVTFIASSSASEAKVDALLIFLYLYWSFTVNRITFPENYIFMNSNCYKSVVSFYFKPFRRLIFFDSVKCKIFAHINIFIAKIVFQVFWVLHLVIYFLPCWVHQLVAIRLLPSYTFSLSSSFLRQFRLVRCSFLSLFLREFRLLFKPSVLQ